MQYVAGMALPDGDTHFAPIVAGSERIDGRGTYQLRKYRRVLEWGLPGRRVALDIGAHVGLWSRVMARDFALVLAVEPDPRLAACWRANVGGVGNASLLEMALGDAPGSVDRIGFAPAAANSGNGRISEGAPAEVRLGRLDDVAEAFSTIDFIKLDVEGYEARVLRGGLETLRRCRPAVLVEQKGHEEWFGEERCGAVALLQRLGMRTAFEIGGDFFMVWE